MGLNEIMYLDQKPVKERMNYRAKVTARPFVARHS
jgi:hypothetical protein